MDWKDIAEAAQAEAEASRRQIEEFRQREDRRLERENKRRIVSASAAVKRESPTHEPTKAEKKAAAMATLADWAIGSGPAETETKTHEQHTPAPGSLAERIKQREEKAQAERDERKVAVDTLAALLGNMRR